MPRPSETAWIWSAIAAAACLGACVRGPLNTAGLAEDAAADAADTDGEIGGEISAPIAVVDLTPTAIGADRSSALHDQATLAHLPTSEAQWSRLCARGHADPITERLCKRPKLESLADLFSALGLSFTSHIGNGELGNPSFALLSHSTSLAGRHVSPINPRVFVFTSPATEGPISGAGKKDPGFIALAFARGEPLVELAARDTKTGELRFFLVRVALPCEGAGCSAAELYGPSIESGWDDVSVYDDTDLENTVFDCNVCHQPGGPSSPKMLRMIEQRPPWTHFFRDNDQGKLLVADYFRAHDKSETYGGVPGHLVSWSEPARLEGLVEHEGFIQQPLELPTRDLARQVMKGEDPAKLPAYVALYERARVGQSLPVPFPDYAFVAPATLATAAKTYRELIKPDAPLLDAELGDLHSQDARARVGLVPSPGADGEAVLLQMCARCHNGSLDQSLSRANFDATRLGALDEAERARAIERMRLPDSSPLKMPPPRFGSLSERDIAAASGVLDSR
jgi:cytochrome c553